MWNVELKQPHTCMLIYWTVWLIQASVQIFIYFNFKSILTCTVLPLGGKLARCDADRRWLSTCLIVVSNQSDPSWWPFPAISSLPSIYHSSSSHGTTTRYRLIEETAGRSDGHCVRQATIASAAMTTIRVSSSRWKERDGQRCRAMPRGSRHPIGWL